MRPFNAVRHTQRVAFCDGIFQCRAGDAGSGGTLAISASLAS
jgi:hypothetical protein